MRASLVSAEVALAVVLTIGAGLMLQTLWKLQQVDPGFRADRRADASRPAHRRQVPQRLGCRLLRADVLERLRAAPGVTAARGNPASAIQRLFLEHPVRSGRARGCPGCGRPDCRHAHRHARLLRRHRAAPPGRARHRARRRDAAREVARRQRASGHAVLRLARRGAIGRTVRSRSAQGPGSPLTIVGVVGRRSPCRLDDRAGAGDCTPRSLHTASRDDACGPHGRRSAGAGARVREADLVGRSRCAALRYRDDGRRRSADSLGRPRLLLTLLGAFAALGALLAAGRRLRRRRLLGRAALARARDHGRAGRRARAHRARACSARRSSTRCAGLAIGMPAALGRQPAAAERWCSASRPTDPTTYVAIAAATLIDRRGVPRRCRRFAPHASTLSPH